MPYTVSVVGLGYLGAVHAVCLAEMGHQVVALDIDGERVSKLAGGEAPFYEPGFQELLSKAQRAGRLTFTEKHADMEEAEVHFLCLGTPQSDTGAADTSQIDAAVDALAPHLTPNALVVGKSTVPVGTSALTRVRLQQGAVFSSPVRLAWNPEFLREGSAIRDTLVPSRLVYGVSGPSANADVRRLDEIYQPLLQSGVPRVVTSMETAELAKVAANAFLAMKISFINAFADLCEISGGDIVELAEILGLDQRIGRQFLNAGLGFGGGCLPKDIRAVASHATDLGVHDIARLMREVDRINLGRRTRLMDIVTSLCGGSVAGRRIAILGAAFKAGSDDVRDSPALVAASVAAESGADVVVHDPKALTAARAAYPRLGYADSVLGACAGADLVLHLTEWNEYLELDPCEVGKWVKRRVMVDARNTLDATRWLQAGWSIVGMGRTPSSSTEGSGE